MTAISANELERNNLLKMPSQVVQPGTDLMVTYRFGATVLGVINPLVTSGAGPGDGNAVGKLTTALDNQANFYRVGGLAKSGSAISGVVKVRANATARTVEGLFSQCTSFVKDGVQFDLMQVVPAHMGTTAGAFSAEDAAGINAGTQNFRPAVARAVSNVVHTVTAAADDVANKAAKVTGNLKWIVLGVVLLVGVFYAIPFLPKKKGGD